MEIPFLLPRSIPQNLIQDQAEVTLEILLIQTILLVLHLLTFLAYEINDTFRSER